MNPNYRRRELKKRSIKTAALLLGAIIVVLMGYAGYSKWMESKRIIPLKISKQLSFPVYWPKDSTVANADKTTIQYSDTSKLLTFTATTKSGSRLIVSEQATPESINDIPQVYDKLIESLLQYSSFDSVNGKVFLTLPKELNGGQSAVMNAKGTLLFVKPSKNLSNDEWKLLFNNLETVK